MHKLQLELSKWLTPALKPKTKTIVKYNLTVKNVNVLRLGFSNNNTYILAIHFRNSYKSLERNSFTSKRNSMKYNGRFIWKFLPWVKIAELDCHFFFLIEPSIIYRGSGLNLINCYSKCVYRS